VKKAGARKKPKRRYDISRPNTRDTRTKGNPINDEITDNELRVIDANGEQAGIMLLEAALSLADRQGFDLVLISPSAKPPVAKIMDYGKYRYDQQKREKEARKKQKIIEVKEIRLSTFIDQHDLEIKGTMAKRFLTEGDKLKVSLRFKGRERGRTDRGFEVMQRFAEAIKEYGTPEKTPALEGRSLIMIVNPLPPKKEKVAKPEEGSTAAAADAGAGDAALKDSAGRDAAGSDAAAHDAAARDGAAAQDAEKTAPTGGGDPGAKKPEAKKPRTPSEPGRKKPKGPSDEMD
jgi:translation initiation factor IF-3